MICTAIPHCHELLLLAIGLSNGAIIALNALGFTLLYAAVKTINLAYGDVFALSGVMATTVLATYGAEGGGAAQAVLTVGVALAAATLFGGTLNIAVERLAFRPFRNHARLAPLIATVGLSFMLYQVALLWRAPFVVPRILPAIPLLISPVRPEITYQLKDVLVVLIAAGLALAVGWLLSATCSGRAFRALAQDDEMAVLCGVPRDRTVQLVFALGGGLAGAAACVYVLYYARPYGQYGLSSGLIALTAAVLGGIGNPRGTFFAGLILGTLAALGERFLTAQWTQALVLGVLVMLLVLRPTGLRGDISDNTPQAGALLGAAAKHRRSVPSKLLLGAALCFALLYPLLDRAFALGRTTSATGLLIFVLLALGLNILLGFAGLLNLGYAGSYAIGAYVTALLITTHGTVVNYIPRAPDLLLVLACGAGAAAIYGVLLAFLTRRLAGDYLAIVTLAGAQIFQSVVRSLEITGGSRGIAARAPLHLFGFAVQTPLAWYYLAVALALLGIAGTSRLLGSRTGRAWRAYSFEPIAAASSGIDPVYYRRLAFVLGSGVAGLAGALFTVVVGYVDPDQVDVRIAVLVLAMIVIGGAGSVWGAVGGALIVAGLDQLAIPIFGAWTARLAQQTQSPWLAALDIRALNFLAFGLVLYGAIVIRTREGRSGETRD